MRQSVFVLALLATLAAPALAQPHAHPVATPPVPGPHGAHRDHAVATHDALARAIGDPRRSAENRARDRWRHPMETLSFFDVRPGQTIVEYSPGGGWYTEILAPLVKGDGRYIGFGSERSLAGLRAKFVTNAAWWGPGDLVVFDPARPAPAPGTVDRVLTFRNVHNLLMQGEAPAESAFRAFFAALKPGGILGVVDHRLPEDRDSALERTSGYVKRSTIVRLAERAGFRLAGESQINANPRDNHDHPKGVWSLPPTLQGGAADADRFTAIGESDRLTLKFVKPD